jgi:hypothetical protein
MESLSLAVMLRRLTRQLDKRLDVLLRFGRRIRRDRTRWRSGVSNPRIWTQPRSQAARSTKVKPVAFVYTASARSSVICSGP